MENQNGRTMLIGAVVLGVVIVLFGGFLLFRDKGVTVTVTSIPNDLTLTVDGQPVNANGEVKIKSGTHTLTGERRGFQTYSTTIKGGSGDELAIKMYLYANSSEGRDWARNNPDQELELEAEAGRQYDQTQDRLVQRYPILLRLPYIGAGYEVNYTNSKSDPKNPEAISVTVETWTADGKDKALQWIQEDGTDPATLDIIYSVTK
ncbi:PEGA domain-containing protein [Kribbella antibiotica]|uniref:PEGA domain-containing protein n=1 Tax=Kribbella antibiotica TaxID=190195 RepID=A0A4R4ZKV2_9ACTN|nr:PEGA domain-containing protein [Kribbella antibiotica]TDD58239.1 PEGA domain-containing protein [Kribbella antibiotica]